MFQHGRKIGDLKVIEHPESWVQLSAFQAQSYLVAINALSLIDANRAHVVLPVSTGKAQEVSYLTFLVASL